MSATSGLLYTGIIWTFEDCQFINNTANTNNGGAVDLYLRDNTGTDGDGDFVEPAFSFRNCLFDSNTALGNDGGALQIRTRGDVVDALTIIENCTFTNNKTADTVDDGGALNLDYSHSGDSRKDMITDCLFSNNSSGNAGGAVSVSGGGGGEITIERCEFTSNTAVSNNGGACLFAPGGTSSVILKNCLFAKNYVTAAGTDGGAIAFDGVAREIINCTFVDNSSADLGGAIIGLSNDAEDSMDIYNCIFSGNTCGNTAGGALENSNAAMPTNADYLLFHNNTNDTVNVTLGSNVFTGDPLYVDAANMDYHLTSDSPAIDAGTATRAPDKDLDGNDRPRGGGYDLGAYEAPPGPTGTSSWTLYE